MIKRLLLLLVVTLSASPAAAQTKNDYGDDKTWLCRPGRPGTNDACVVDLATTVVKADGTLTREAWTANPNPPIDCFYVYPTVSTDQTPNSDMTADPAERNVVRLQLARFGSRCRLFAPLYRQVTLLALRANTAGKPLAVDRDLAYHDVLDAWNHYLNADNNGRGVVLIGHSQGSSVLVRLIREQIDGKPVQSRLVSALLLGTNVAVPKGKDVVDTPFVSVPGLLEAQCVSNEKGSYLEVTVHGNPSDPRTDEITGDVMTNGKPNASWGLHLIDVNLSMGNLLDLVASQARAFAARPRSQ
jgi:hypothetical protein